MNTYIGCKIIKAEKMGKGDFYAKYKNAESPDSNMIQEDGYHVEYPDGYHSWSPTLVFEQAYRLITEQETNLIK